MMEEQIFARFRIFKTSLLKCRNKKLINQLYATYCIINSMNLGSRFSNHQKGSQTWFSIQLFTVVLLSRQDLLEMFHKRKVRFKRFTPQETMQLFGLIWFDIIVVFKPQKKSGKTCFIELGLGILWQCFSTGIPSGVFMTCWQRSQA